MESNIDTKNDAESETHDTSSCGYITADNIQRALAALHLPLRPVRAETPCQQSSGSNPPKPAANQYPSISILVCADFDLKSTAALAEYALRQQNEIFDAKSIDLVVAAGPSHSGAEMLKYYQGNSKLKYLRNSDKIRNNCCRNISSENHLEASYTKDSGRVYTPGFGSTKPFFRSKEELAALEGLITAALSQLESIVCRVVYCPGWNDPLSLLQPQPSNKRLTSHSHNVNQHYLPLAPGLGCSGLFYLDHAEDLVEHFKRKQSERSVIQNCAISNHLHNKVDDEDSESSEQEDGSALLLDQIKELQALPGNYYKSLELLLQLAPQPKYPNAIFNGENKGQLFLITHYVDSHSLIGYEKSTMDDGCDDDDSFDEIFELNNPMKDKRGHSPTSNVSENTKDDVYDDSSGPWPNGHQEFLSSSIARKNLCFEIATGLSSKYHQPEWIPFARAAVVTDDVSFSVDRGSLIPGPGVLFPGSLREQGDFCIVHLSLVQQQSSMGLTQTQSHYGWEVQNVEFHTVNKFKNGYR